MPPTTTDETTKTATQKALGFLGGTADSLIQGYSAYRGLQEADGLQNYGAALNSQLQTMGNTLNTGSQFQGYGVTSNLGQSTVGTDGSINLGVSQHQGMNNAANAYQQAGLQALANAGMGTANREQEIYDRAMAMQNPALNRAQAAQQAREYAMGRGGVRGSQFGGTAEDAAMARARADASNTAAFQAMQQGQTEMMNQANMANGFSQMGQANYQTSFLPMQQQMALLAQGGQDADRAQTGQLTGLQYLAQLGLGGAQVDVNAQKAASELQGNIYDSLLDNSSSFFDFLG
jgi:hypothetical protein